MMDAVCFSFFLPPDETRHGQVPMIRIIQNLVYMIKKNYRGFQPFQVINILGKRNLNLPNTSYGKSVYQTFSHFLGNFFFRFGMWQKSNIKIRF